MFRHREVEVNHTPVTMTDRYENAVRRVTAALRSYAHANAGSPDRMHTVADLLHHTADTIEGALMFRRVDRD
jgi:hypothetical protein